MFYVALICFYFIICRAARGFVAWKYPKAPTSAVPERLIANMIEVSHRAFPLYVTVRPWAARSATQSCSLLDALSCLLPKQAPCIRASSSSVFLASLITTHLHRRPLVLPFTQVPMLGDFFRVKGWSRECDTVDECGGWVPALVGCVVYFLAVEMLIFIDHYYFLHKLDIGKRLMKHAYHHVYKCVDSLAVTLARVHAPVVLCSTRAASPPARVAHLSWRV
jgi:lathosterol oxidase